MHATQATLPFPGPPRASAAARDPGASLQSVKVSGDSKPLLFKVCPRLSRPETNIPKWLVGLECWEEELMSLQNVKRVETL